MSHRLHHGMSMIFFIYMLKKEYSFIIQRLVPERMYMLLNIWKSIMTTWPEKFLRYCISHLHLNLFILFAQYHETVSAVLNLFLPFIHPTMQIMSDIIHESTYHWRYKMKICNACVCMYTYSQGYRSFVSDLLSY